MKKLLFVIPIIFLTLTAEKCEKSATSDNCKNVPKLNWQEETPGYDSETALKIVASLQAAAQADAVKSKELNASGNASVDISSELAKVVNKSVKQESKVTQEFWQQDLTFRQILCYYDAAVNNKNTSEATKQKYHDAILELTKLRADYTFEVSKKKSGAGQ
jgi:hypothetical protein